MQSRFSLEEGKKSRAEQWVRSFLSIVSYNLREVRSLARYQVVSNEFSWTGIPVRQVVRWGQRRFLLQGVNQHAELQISDRYLDTPSRRVLGQKVDSSTLLINSTMACRSYPVTGDQKRERERCHKHLRVPTSRALSWGWPPESIPASFGA